MSLPGIVHSAAMNEIADQHQLKCVAVFCTCVPCCRYILGLGHFIGLLLQYLAALQPFVLWCCLASTESVEVIPS